MGDCGCWHGLLQLLGAGKQLASGIDVQPQPWVPREARLGGRGGQPCGGGWALTSAPLWDADRLLGLLLAPVSLPTPASHHPRGLCSPDRWCGRSLGPPAPRGASHNPHLPLPFQSFHPRRAGSATLNLWLTPSTRGFSHWGRCQGCAIKRSPPHSQANLGAVAGMFIDHCPAWGTSALLCEYQPGWPHPLPGSLGRGGGRGIVMNTQAHWPPEGSSYTRLALTLDRGSWVPPGLPGSRPNSWSLIPAQVGGTQDLRLHSAVGQDQEGPMQVVRVVVVQARAQP